ncbi:dynein assembly factor 1, axonemal homolog [Drosophila subpulchrella]|uniref:dynein assembly factor 1, axonemal homolog n=1 Tax=Drosophila subpulchrella TaxID=1486046 RepID=UPI0018A12F16|nr:dynein assembly factor 1, axonemal homolog [Drosophila subpulchrella]
MSEKTGVVAPRREITGLNRMTSKGLKELCKKDKLYQTPRLNDVLYLHYQGYQSIECLEEYTELKCLWLECNAISEIQGLEQLTKLKCLFLQNNLITKMENLEPCKELDTLNLSSNHIRKIQNIGSDILPVLNTLNISSNYLKDCESLSDLVQCKTLSVLDLSNNRIDDILIVKVFEQMPSLKVLVLQGNPVVSRLPQYRKTLILACKELTYLDSRPVFPRDRACAEAWKKDGYEGERKENNRWNRAERRKIRESVNSTIRMRNRHRPPDQQDPLLRSSDSEDDTCAERSRKRAELENGGVDDLWDEVSGEQPNSEHSSSTCSSAEENGSAGSQDDHIAEKISNRKPLEGRPKSLYESDMNNAEKVETNVKKEEDATKTEHTDDKDVVNLKTEHTDNKGVVKAIRVPIEEAKLEELNIEKERIDRDLVNDKPEETVNPSIGTDLTLNTSDQRSVNEAERKDTTKEDELIKSNGDIVPEIDSSSELDNDEDLENTCKTLTTIAQNNDLEEDQTNKEFKSKLIDEMYESFGADIDVDIDEPLDLILSEGTTNYKPDERLSCEEKKTPREFYQEDVEPRFTPKTKEQLEFELDCAFANDKCAYDLKEMGSQMEEDLEELRQSTQNLVGPVKEVTSQSDPESEDEPATQHDVKSRLLAHQSNERRLKMKLREETKAGVEPPKDLNDSLLKESVTDDKQDQAFAKTLDDTTDNGTLSKETVTEDEQDQLFAKILDDATDNVPKRVFGSGCDAPSQDWPQEECMRQLTISETSVQEDIFIKPITNMTSAEEAEEICIQMDKKLAGEEEALRKLLQDLEDDVNETYDIETTVEYEETITTEETDVAGICNSLLDDIIVEVTFNELVRAKKPKSFEFGPIESDDEFSYSAEPELEKLVPPELEDPARGKSLRECLDTFADFVTSMGDPKLPLLLGRKPTAGVEKIRAAQKLLKSKNLAEFNKDTAESLDAQIAKEKEKLKRRVAASATRCFNQREKYEDTLEVVENRLMVVKKDTGELEELPPPPALISDTESEDYDTAEEEYTPGGHNQEARRPWTTPYKPKPRKSEEHLVIEAMQQREMETALQGSPEDGREENDPAEDEFFSLEAMTTFGNLDSEFFQKLDFHEVNASDDAESAIECMRSYNELKAYMKAGSTEHQLTSEENEMLQAMISNESSEENIPSTPKREEEDDLLKKMVIRMKEYEERERQLQLAQADIPQELGPISLSLGGSKLFEQKSEITEAVNGDSENKTDDNLESKDNEDSYQDKHEANHFTSSQVEECVRIPRACQNKSIDDDIQSDASTDYESGEEVDVVEPPKLPEAVLRSFYSEGFEADLKMVHDLQEATRRNIQPPTTKTQKSNITSSSYSHPNNLMPGIFMQETQKEIKSPSTSEQSISARAKWAKIAERLHEFLDPETIEMFNKQEFGESDECEDDEDENIISDILTTSESVPENTEVFEKDKFGNAEILTVLDEHTNQQNIDNTNSSFSNGEDIVQIENLDKNIICEQKVISNPEVKCLISEGGEMKSTLAPDKALEKVLQFDKNSSHEEHCETSQNESEKLTPQESSRTEHFKIDYFEDPEPTEIEIDRVQPECLKTEQIECNLEILSEDGDVVVKELSVSAQVTFK